MIEKIRVQKYIFQRIKQDSPKTFWFISYICNIKQILEYHFETIDCQNISHFMRYFSRHDSSCAART